MRRPRAGKGRGRGRWCEGASISRCRHHKVFWPAHKSGRRPKKGSKGCLRLLDLAMDPVRFPQHTIARKRDGHALSADEIKWFVRGATDGSWADYQLSAMLM